MRNHAGWKLWTAVAVVVATAAVTQAARRKTPEVAKVKATVASELVKASEPVTLTVAVAIDEGWHVNSNAPELDYLIPTRLALADEAPFELGDVSYPKGHKRELKSMEKPITLYEGKFDVTADLKLRAGTDPGLQVIEGYLRYQACNDTTCLRPKKAKFSVPVTVAAE